MQWPPPSGAAAPLKASVQLSESATRHNSDTRVVQRSTASTPSFGMTLVYLLAAYQNIMMSVVHLRFVIRWCHCTFFPATVPLAGHMANLRLAPLRASDQNTPLSRVSSTTNSPNAALKRVKVREILQNPLL